MKRLLAGPGALVAAILAVASAASLCAETSVQIDALDTGRWSATLAEADAAVAQGDFARAVELLQRVVVFGEDRLVIVEENEPVGPGDPVAGDEVGIRPRGLVRPRAAPRRSGWNNVVAVPAAEEARRRIARLPPAGVEAYRTAHEATATALLEQARRENDAALLSRVARHYAATASGVAARSLLADRFVARGYFRRALRLLLELDRGALPAASGVDRESVHLRLIAVLRVLGEREAFVAERQRLLDGLPPERTLGGFTKLAELESRIPLGAPPAVVVPTLGGTVGRSFSHQLPRLHGGPSSYVLEWNSHWWAHQQGIAPPYMLYSRSRFMDQSQFLVFTPEFTRSDVFLSGVFHLWRIDLETGRLVDSPVKPVVPVDAYELYLESSDSPLYTATEAGGIVYTHTITHLVPEQSYLQYMITEDRPTRSLVAYDVESGRWLWNTRRLFAGSPDDPKLISLVTPPLIRGERIYAGGVYLAGLFTSVVVCLDARSGAPIWQRRLASGQMELTMFGEPAREPFASVLVEDEGIIYHVTQLGAVAAIEAETGAIRWIGTYDPIATTPTLGPVPELRDIVWNTSAPILAGGVLYVAPRDAHSYYGIDTGLRYSERGGAPPEGGRIVKRYLNGSGMLRDPLGYRAGRIYFGGPGGIAALDVDGGPGGNFGRATDERAAGNTRVYGRAALVDRGIVFCTRTSVNLIDYTLEQVVPLTESPLQRSQYGEYPGNVSIAGHRIVLTSRDLLSSFVPRASLPGEEF